MLSINICLSRHFDSLVSIFNPIALTLSYASFKYFLIGSIVRLSVIGSELTLKVYLFIHSTNIHPSMCQTLFQVLLMVQVDTHLSTYFPHDTISQRQSYSYTGLQKMCESFKVLWCTLQKLFCDFMHSVLVTSLFNYKPEQKSALETFVPKCYFVHSFFNIQIIIYKSLLEICKDPQLLV